MKNSYSQFSPKQIQWLKATDYNTFNILEGTIRAGKNVIEDISFCKNLEIHPDKFFLIAGATIASAKMNVYECNGMGIANFFGKRATLGEYEDKPCAKIQTKMGEKIIVFAGGGKKGCENAIRGQTYGMVILTEVNDLTLEFINVAIGRTLTSSNRKVYMDFNPKAPKHPFYVDFLNPLMEQKKKDASFPLNYQLLTLADNLSISDDKLREILKSYPNKESVFYKRDIRGIRCQAEGLIYDYFSNNLKKYLIDKEEAEKKVYDKIIVGVDFGGNGSKHAFCCIGICKGFKNVVVLKSRRVESRGMTPNELDATFIDFVNEIKLEYGKITEARCDSAEQTLINGFKSATIKSKCSVNIRNAIKSPIIDRIKGFQRLVGLNRIQFVESETKSLVSALCEAVWQDKDNQTEDVRLDNGTTDIDSLDAFEYAFESDLKLLTQM